MTKLHDLTVLVSQDSRHLRHLLVTPCIKQTGSTNFFRPLEKVNQFFDGVSARIAAGVKEAEISYQLQFSKQELRKVRKWIQFS